MSPDEALFTVVSLMFGPAAWIWWIFRASGIAGFRAGPSLTTIVAVLVICMVLMAGGLRWGAADDVRYAPGYFFMYVVMGCAWLRLAVWGFPLLGLNPRDDLLERRNAAAMPAWVGAMIGVTCCYIGGNIGNGPGWWVVVFSSGLATAALGLAWFVVGQYSKAMDAVTIERDPAAGWRLGGLLLGVGLVCGFAATGDWVSAPDTVFDFVSRAGPMVPVVLIAAVIERRAQPTADRLKAPLVTHGVVPALVYIGAAVAIVALEWRTL